MQKPYNKLNPDTPNSCTVSPGQRRRVLDFARQASQSSLSSSLILEPPPRCKIAIQPVALGGGSVRLERYERKPVA